MMHFSRPGGVSGNPIANALVVVAGTVLIALSLVLGFFVFLFIAGVVLLMSAVVAVRMWWFRRKHHQFTANEPRGDSTQEAADGTLIEGEFSIVEDESSPGSDRRK